jgi:hypothetical protein
LKSLDANYAVGVGQMAKNLKEVIKNKLQKNTDDITTKYGKIATEFAKKETK